MIFRLVYLIIYVDGHLDGHTSPVTDPGRIMHVNGEVVAHMNMNE